MTIETPNPGSREAWDQGCVCPGMDNAWGRHPADWQWWVIRMDCPLHAHPEPEMLQHYSRALDEIYRLREVLAYEARVVEAHLDYKTFPKSRRRAASEQIERMREAAKGHAEVAYAGTTHLRKELDRLDGRGLSRARWEAEAPRRPSGQQENPNG